MAIVLWPSASSYKMAAYGEVVLWPITHLAKQYNGQVVLWTSHLEGFYHNGLEFCGHLTAAHSTEKTGSSFDILCLFLF